MNVRRVVTGHTSSGKAGFVSDTVVEPQSVPGIAFEFLRLWGTVSLPQFPDAGTLPPYRDYFPPVGACASASSP